MRTHTYHFLLMDSGREAIHSAIISMHTPTNSASHHGGPENMKKTTNPHNIPLQAAIFARRGMTPASRHATSMGPNLGWCNSQCSNRGDERPNAQAAAIRKTVVGIKGNSAPIIPSRTNKHPRKRYPRRRPLFKRERFSAGGLSCVFIVV